MAILREPVGAKSAGTHRPPPFPPRTPEADRLTRLPHLRIRPNTATKGLGGWENGLPCHPPPTQSKFIPALHLYTILHMPFSMLLHTLSCMPDALQAQKQKPLGPCDAENLGNGNLRAKCEVCTQTVCCHLNEWLNVAAPLPLRWSKHPHTLAHTFVNALAHPVIRASSTPRKKWNWLCNAEQSWQQESACKM